MSTTIQPARYRLRLWRRFSCWGATDDEVAGPYPGAELVPDAKRSPTMAVTIKAPPEQVWPWLVQLGWDRGGWYSWDLLDNAGRQSATRVHPEWQHLAVGDQLQFWAMGRVMDAYRVAVIEPNRFLGLYGYTDLRGRWLDAEQPRPSSYMEALWGFLLNELPDGRTRLVVSGYQTFRPRWVERFIAPWLLTALSWPMQARMMTVLKRNIERVARTGPTSMPGRAASVRGRSATAPRSQENRAATPGA
jgi:proline iminopeptidase